MHESIDFPFNYIKWIAKSVKKRGKNDIIPVKLLSERSSSFRDVRLPITDGILPET